VPAAAVKRMGLVLFVLTGRKGSVGGDLNRQKKKLRTTLYFTFILSLEFFIWGGHTLGSDTMR